MRVWLVLAVACAHATHTAAQLGSKLKAAAREKNALPLGRPLISKLTNALNNLKPLTDGDTFDYIVVGAGGTGAALASRLALAGKDVLLVEAGLEPDYFTQIPGAAPLLLGGQFDWKYQTQTNNISCLSYRNKQCRFSRGKCFGGSTSTNYMMYTRGNPLDYDDLGVDGWTWADMKPYFLKYEGLQDLDKLPVSSQPYHNTTGTMKVELFVDAQNPWHERVQQGFEQLGFPFNPDVNAESQIGVSRIVGYVFDKVRMSTARGYLSRSDVKSQLKVARLTRCEGVIVDDDNVARGVNVIHGIFKKKMQIFARKEVIISAGTVGSPHILQLSGIGPAEHLREMNIPVKADLPVGDNMSDHLLPLLFVQVDSENKVAESMVKSGQLITNVAEMLLMKIEDLASNGLTDITTFMNSLCYDVEYRRLRNDTAGVDCNVPTLQFVHAFMDRFAAYLAPLIVQQGTDLNDDIIDQLRELSFDYAFIVVSPAILRPYSVGRIRLASADPEAQPAIFPDYLSDERDVDEMVRAITVVEHLVDTPAYKQHNAAIVKFDLPDCPAFEQDRDGYWRCYTRHLTHTVFHAVGTCSLGAVVDEELRVFNVSQLRVADLSVLPKLPRGNTAASAIAIGERAADFILNAVKLDPEYDTPKDIGSSQENKIPASIAPVNTDDDNKVDSNTSGSALEGESTSAYDKI